MKRKSMLVFRWLIVLFVLAACTSITPTPSPTPEATSTPPLRAYRVEQVSMQPTLHEGEILLIEEVPAAQLRHGDIIVVLPPGRQNPPILKRLIGLPGETIAIRAGKVYINDKVLDEPYIYEPMSRGDFPPITLKPDEYYVMGDNRNNSSDSRYYGPIPSASIFGRVKQ